MMVADYKDDIVRSATREEVQQHWSGSERRLARDKGWAPPTEPDDMQRSPIAKGPPR